MRRRLAGVDMVTERREKENVRKREKRESPGSHKRQQFFMA